MEIKKIETYVIAGKQFSTPEKAFAHVDELVAEHVRKMFVQYSIPYKAIISCTEYILENRKELAELLAVETFNENQE